MSYALTTSETAVSPLHLWRLDEASSVATATDVGSSPLALTWTGTHKQNIGQVGAIFDGATYAAHPHVGGGDTYAGDYTIMGWIKIPAGNQNGRIACWGGGGSLIIGDGNFGSGNTLYAGLDSQGAAASTNKFVVTPNVWTHVAVTRSGTTYTLYKNGVSQGAQTVAGSAAFFNDFYVGAKYDGTTFFTGESSGIIFCSAARSAPEILAIVNSGIDAPPLATRQTAYTALGTGMMIHYGLPTFGTVANDSAGNTDPIDNFAPTNTPAVQVRNWCSNAVAIGAKYIIFTDVHNGALYFHDTAQSVRKTTNLAHNSADYLLLLSQECAAWGLKLVVYIGNLDNNDTRDALIVGEILSGTYGTITAILYDHNDPATQAAKIAVMQAAVKNSPQPGCLYFNNGHDFSFTTSDALVYETFKGANGATTVVSHVGTTGEALDTIYSDDLWFSNSVSPHPIRDWQLIAGHRYFIAKNGSNYTLNIPPDTSGLQPTALIDTARKGMATVVEIAGGKAATASTSFDASHGATNAVTGNVTSGTWWQSGDTDNQPLLTIPLGLTGQVTAVIVFAAGTDGAGLERMRDVTVSVLDANNAAVSVSPVLGTHPDETFAYTNYALEYAVPSSAAPGAKVTIQRNAANLAGPWHNGAAGGSDTKPKFEVSGALVFTSGTSAGDLTPMKQSVSLSQAANAASVAMAETVVSPDASTFNAEWTNSAAGDVRVNFRFRLTAGGQLYDGAAVIITAGTVTPINKPVSLPKGIYSIVPLMTRTDGLTAGVVTAAGFLTAF